MNAERWYPLAALAVIVAWGVAILLALRKRRRRIAETVARLDSELSRRHELVGRLLQTGAPVLQQAGATLQAVRQAHALALEAMAAVRPRPLDARAVGRLALAELRLDEALERLRAVASTHAVVDSDGILQALVHELSILDGRIDHTRRAYNSEVLDYNDEASLFPAAVIARLCGYAPAATLLAAAPAQGRGTQRVAY